MTRLATGFRFAPPALEPTPEIRWLLLRAFGPPEAESPAVDAARAVEHARRCGLAPRIAGRVPEALLAEELGEAAAGLAEARRQAASHALAYEEVIESLSRVADAIPRPVVLLKGAALHAAGWVAPGGRGVGDLDVLIDPAGAEEFLSGLTAVGFRPSDGPRNEQHLPPLEAPSWGIVDLHDGLRGVCGATDAWLDASGALAVGEPLEVRPACWVPERRLVAAHVLAHALEQHAWSPAPYPLLRALSDVVDLLPDDGAWSDALPELTGWLRYTLSGAELAAARDLCRALEQGRPPEAVAPEARRLLTHCLAYSLDDAYRAGLRGRHRRHRLGQAIQRGTLLRYAGRKLSDWWRRSATD